MKVLAMILFAIYLSRVRVYEAVGTQSLDRSSVTPLVADFMFKSRAIEVMLDLALVSIAYYTSYRLRFEGQDLDIFLPYFTASLPVVVGCKLASLYLSGLYQRSWGTFGLRDIAVVDEQCQQLYTGRLQCFAQLIDVAALSGGYVKMAYLKGKNPH